MGQNILSAELRAELDAVAEGEGCELIHAGFQGSILRLVLDRPEGGVTLKDCEKVSRQASPLLDVYDLGKDRYTLEVSSPGLDRELYGPRDYERFVGRLARVRFRPGQGSDRQTVVGRLEDYDGASGGSITLLPEAHSGPGGDRLEIPLADIETARLEIEL